MKKSLLVLSAIISGLLLFSAAFAQNSTNNSNSTEREYRIGDLVEAADHRGAWYKSKITGIDKDKYHVHFFGWSSAWDEWVGAEKIRYSEDYEFGREVEVEQNGVWYKALLIDSRYGTEHLVSYIGYNEDEWVKDARIRGIDFNGRPWRGGERTVEVASGKKRDKWLRAQILKRRAGEVYVHYEGCDDAWNEWVSEDRIRRIK